MLIFECLPRLEHINLSHNPLNSENHPVVDQRSIESLQQVLYNADSTVMGLNEVVVCQYSHACIHAHIQMRMSDRMRSYFTLALLLNEIWLRITCKEKAIICRVAPSHGPRLAHRLQNFSVLTNMCVVAILEFFAARHEEFYRPTTVWSIYLQT